MSEFINLASERQRLLELPEKLDNEPIIITDQGKPVMVALRYEQYESLIETINILADEEFANQLKKGIKEDREGKTVSWEEAKKQLGWE
ncbi:type II toxin-antitoxin system Phd/YefM family antitoxin [Oscillatoria salina]|uniref:type II toxin-antitoxin system Phd/YefM family antitoxin n=1 Tax=Oscillatoria salina TaxID=331517 RepID=UPI0013BE1EC2|nr:type II toxin-antitoxin system Phd/YefM family antitoxin [Oscillatoria salina]MBZ8182788.1 type II toxin-antitoxin system Phd/YefM family antitoxin [Oscillatoria salina IIICB1]NET90019.1 type II toxin-antitoxin system Phd/YefM family antitoxin [Kamptonema sp. SIO1D9]